MRHFTPKLVLVTISFSFETCPSGWRVERKKRRLLRKIQAEKEGRKLKNYMEHILREKANSFELSDEYKAMMDDMLDKHEKGKLNYTPWEEVKKQLLSK